MISLRIATLNTWGLPWPIARPHRDGRYAHVSRYLKDAAFDLVGLQEVWRGAPRLSVDGLHQRPEMETAGLALVTQLKVVETRFHGFGKRWFVPWVEKGAQHARLLHPSGLEIDVVNTHLQAYVGAKFAKMRKDQTNALLELVEGSPRPVILVGDFNYYEDHTDDRQSAAVIVDRGFRDALGQAPPSPTFFAPNETERFDRIYVRDGTHARIRVESHHVEHYRIGARKLPMLSDHLPVEAKLAIETPSS